MIDLNINCHVNFAMKQNTSITLPSKKKKIKKIVITATNHLLLHLFVAIVYRIQPVCASTTVAY